METVELFALEAKHDLRHKLGSGPYARESLVFTLQLPEQQLAALVYTWVNGSGEAGAALAVYGAGVAGPPLFDGCDGVAVADDMDFDDWRVGCVHVRHGAALQVADVRCVASGVSLDYHFEAMHPAYNYAASREGCPAWMATDRYEQSGRVSGTLRIGDRAVTFDTFGHRDHSWGTRDWGRPQQSKWLEAQTGPDVAVHVVQYAAVGRTGLMGYVHKEGRIEEVTEARIDFMLDDKIYHTAMEFVIVDAAARTTTVNCQLFALYELKVSPLYTLNEGSMIVTIDGKPGVGHVEMGWPTAYLDYLRAGRA